MNPDQQSQDSTQGQGSNDNDQGQQQLDPVAWRAYIPQEAKDQQYWSRYPDDLSQVLKIHADTQKEIDRRIPLPEKPDDPKWNDVYKALGRPESPEEYKYDLPPLEGVEWKDDAVKGFKEAAHKAGLNKAQYEEVMKYYTGNLEQQVTEWRNEQARQAAETEVKLKNEWGANFGMNRELAKKAAEHLFGEDGLKFVDSAYGNNENVVKGLAKLGRELNEDGLFGGDAGSRMGGISAEDARAEMNAILNDKNNPLNKAYWSLHATADHKAAVKRVEDLAKIVASSQG